MKSSPETGGVWAEVLKVSLGKIGSNFNFFDLGGDSVIAMRLVSVARFNAIFPTWGKIVRTQLEGIMSSVLIILLLTSFHTETNDLAMSYRIKYSLRAPERLKRDITSPLT